MGSVNNLAANSIDPAVAKKNRRSDIWIVIAVVMFLIIKFAVPASGALTEKGVGMLAVFIPTIILWIFVGTDWPSLLAICMLGALDVVPFANCLSVGFGTATTWLTVGMLFCSGVLKELGILDKLAYWVVSRKFIDGHPYRFLLIFYFAVMLIGMWISHAVMVILFSTVGAACCASVGIKKGEKFYNAVLMGVLWIAITAEAIIPYGKITGMTVMAVMEGLGYTLNLGRYLKMSLPFAIIYPIICLLVVRFIMRPDISKFKSYSGEAYRQKLKAEPMTRDQGIALAIYIFLIVALLMPSLTFIPVLPGFFSRVGSSWGAILGMVFMAVIRRKGKPMLDLPTGMSREVPWGVMCFMAASLVFAVYVSSADFGITAMISNALSSAIASVGSSGLTVVAVAAFAVTLIATNFIANSVVAAVCTAAFVPVLAAAYEAGTFGLHPWAVAGIIIINAGLSYLTPPASAMVPFILGPHVPVKVGFKYSLLNLTVSFILGLILVFGIGY